MRPVMQGVDGGGVRTGLARENHGRPQGDGGDRGFSPFVPAQNTHRLVAVGVDREPALGRKGEENSMWQLLRAATSASSGSTAAGSDIGSGTLDGAEDPRTVAPPSKRQSWARE